MGFTWAILPLVGWSHYSVECTQITCSIEWNNISPNVLSYNLTIFIFVFLIPFSFIFIFNIKIVCMVRNLRKFYSSTSLNKLIRKRIKTEKKITTVISVLICAFFVSWSPYSIVSFYSVYSSFNNSTSLHPFFHLIASYFAKTFFVWNPLAYMILNSQFKKSYTLKSLKSLK